MCSAESPQDVCERYGIDKALGYLIGEKLMNSVRAADRHPDHPAELPAFVARIREDFEPHELLAYLDDVHRVGAAAHTTSKERCEHAGDAGMFGEEDVVRGAEDVLLLGRIREMLLA